MRLQKTRIGKYIPTKDRLNQSKIIRFFGKTLLHPDLWRFKRDLIAKGVAVGIFCSFLPIPFQTIPAIILVRIIRGNLPIAAALVWISNPLTWLPFYTPPYLLGNYLLKGRLEVEEAISIESLTQHLSALWLGSLIFAVILSIIGYLVVEAIWRIHIFRYIKVKRARTAPLPRRNQNLADSQKESISIAEEKT